MGGLELRPEVEGRVQPADGGEEGHVYGEPLRIVHLEWHKSDVRATLHGSYVEAIPGAQGSSRPW